MENRTVTLGGVFSSEAGVEIKDTLVEMKSVQDVKVDVNTKQVSFSFDPQRISEDFILNTLNSLGYSPRSNQSH